MSSADTLRRLFALMDEKDDPAIRELLAPGFTALIAGIPPTGKQIIDTFMNFDRFAGDKLVEHRGEADMTGLMQQLDAIPAPA